MIQAVIFDMDGVISNTQKYHAAAESAVLADYGIQLDSDSVTARFAGVSGDEMFQTIFQEHGKKSPNVEQLIKKMADDKCCCNGHCRNARRNFAN